MSAVVTLLTDFGIQDSYVAEVKGVLLTRAPGVVVVDVTHQVPPGDVRSAHYVLRRSWHRFPVGSVHLVVVDPGVGSARRGLAVRHGRHAFVGPDNGVLTPVLDDAVVVSLALPPQSSATFHGRDVFAPAAAALASGETVEALGVRIADPLRAPLPEPRVDGPRVRGEIVYVDRFGTLVTNLPASRAGRATHAVVDGKHVVPMGRTFSDVEPGALVAFVGSDGTVEVAVRDGSAAVRLGVGIGRSVSVSEG